MLGQEQKQTFTPPPCVSCGIQVRDPQVWAAFYAAAYQASEEGGDDAKLVYRLAYARGLGNIHICERCKITQVIAEAKAKLDARKREASWFRRLANWVK